jgi:hypothetical protein
LSWLGDAELGEEGFGFFGRVAFAVISGGDVFGEALADVVAVVEESVAFGIGYEEVEGVVEEVIGGGVASSGDLLEVAGLGSGRDDEAQGGEYTAGGGWG